MEKVLCTFGDSKYKNSLKLLNDSATSIGKVDRVIQYTKEELQPSDFWRKNSFILNRPRGAGYWIWKPYIILETFKQVNDGDVVMYSDAAVEVISDLTPLFDLAESGINNGKVVFQLAGGHNNKTWTKRDTFVLMGLDEEKYWSALQTTASYHLWVKSSENIDYLTQYQRYLRDPRIVTDDPNMAGRPNHLEFKDHRHDQSVLSLMTIRDNFKRYRDPSQYGVEEIDQFPCSDYPKLFNHHRRKS